MILAAPPVFILAAPRSMSSVACAMLGGHPQMYGLPETHLFREDTVGAWLETVSAETSLTPHMADGLLRAVAQICYGDQTESTIVSAAGWVRRRATHTSGMLLEELAENVHPEHLVDKSPSMVFRISNMRRAHRFFPTARFVHLVRHPRAYCASVLTYLKRLTRPKPGEDGPATTAPQWIGDLAFFPYPEISPPEGDQRHADPQGSWYVLNCNVMEFLTSLPDDQWVRIHAEDLVREPARSMTEVATWLNLSTDRESIRSTMHPERSPFARIGPPNARWGNDIFFLQRPLLRPARGAPQNLHDALEWHTDGRKFLPEVQELARSYGYR
jgi:hypothetical protein